MVPAYQPETAYKIFMRAMFDKDIATGLIPMFDEYFTVGPKSTRHITNEVPPYPKPVCYTLALLETCEFEEYWAVVNGTAIVKDYLVVGIEEDRVVTPDFFGTQKVLQEVGVEDVVANEIEVQREEARAKAYAEWRTGSRAARKFLPPF